MRITRLELFSFPVPFKVVFRHASASRRRAENLIVAAHSSCGRVGYGEGCPRSYVTGETVETGRRFIETYRDAMMGAITDAESLRAWIETNRETIDRDPSAFCAVETAILDLLGKIERRPVEQIVGAPPLEGAFAYSAILGDSPYLVYRLQLNRYWQRGFRDYKLKVSGNLTRDKRRVAALSRRSDPALRIRLDANNLWTSVAACTDHLTDLDGDIFAVEEPLQPRDLDGFREIAKTCRCKIILDESLTRAEQLAELQDAETWIVNVRVSKMGGIFRALGVAESAIRAGMGIIVGAQVGETSILTRSALAVMSAAKTNLVAAEGAFGTHLLKQDLAEPCLMFGFKGILDSGRLGLRDAPGLGLEIREDLLLKS